MYRIALFSALALPFFALAQQPKAITSKGKPALTPNATTPSLIKNTVDSFSYALGFNIATNMKQQGVQKINYALMQKAFDDVNNNKVPQLALQACNDVVNRELTSLNEKKQKGLRAEGENFLAINKKKPGITTTASGLQYEIIKAGTGPIPTDTNTVKVHYTGTLINGTKFDSSVDRGQPIEFGVTGVISGWTEALKRMPTGSKWKLYIPYNLAYGERGAGQNIPPYSTLIFEVELLDIVK